MNIKNLRALVYGKKTTAYQRALALKEFKEIENANKGLGICKEKNCNNVATKDYNGNKYYVCDYHYEKLNDYFDEEYD